MPIDSSIVGKDSEPFVHQVDARWTMAYAASLGETLPCYFDTRRDEGIVAHPLFPVCVEWPVMLAMRRQLNQAFLTADENIRAVHATHDLIVHRAVRPGDTLTTRAIITGVEQRKPGAFMTVRFATTDSKGELVCETWEGVMYRNTEVVGAKSSSAEAPALPARNESKDAARKEISIPIATGLAHVYTECARIWNPVHTDVAVAAAAGLPDIILHGTATLALAISRIAEIEAGNDPGRVKRAAGRFAAMVLMPSEVKLRILSREGDGIFFEVLNAEGQPAIKNGFIGLGS
jgi:acyl dehydratase